MLVRSCLKSCMLGFSIMWTENFQMSKLGLGKEEEQEIKLPTLTGLWRKWKFQKNTCLCLDCAKAFDYVDHDKLWKALREMEIPGHFTCLLRNLCVGKEATVRIQYGTTDRFKIEKGIWQGYLLSPCLFNLYAGHIMGNAGLEELQTGIKIGGRKINNLR